LPRNGEQLNNLELEREKKSELRNALWMNKIVEIGEYHKNVCLEFILIKCLEINKTKDNDVVSTWLVGDESGTIELGLWNTVLNAGDVICLNGGYTSLFQGRKRLFVSKSGTISRTRTFRKIFKMSEAHIEL
jgi:ssDNA-binding replication factor A large subunit